MTTDESGDLNSDRIELHLYEYFMLFPIDIPREEPGVAPSITPLPESGITVLTSKALPPQEAEAPLLNKRYFLDDAGQLSKTQYQNATFFDAHVEPVADLQQLAELICRIASDPRKMLIRGIHPVGRSSNIRRKKEFFPEHLEGTPWVMLDFDDIPLSEGTDPLTEDAIEEVIQRLPPEFRSASYFYQHSNSAGILQPDGTPLKSGLNAHVFFWLSRRVPGPKLTAYLKKYCIESGFFTIGENKGGAVDLRYGIDPAPIRSEVQPHYTAAPTIEAGVQCRLRPGERMGLVRKSQDVVSVPELPANIIAQAARLHNQKRSEFHKANGYKLTTLQCKTESGISITRHYVKSDGVVRAGRELSEIRLNPDGKFLRLFFADETSPGSWFVSKTKPQIASRFGDGESMVLRELCPEAHRRIRDELKWFSEIPYQELSLTQQGFLPAFSGFASAKVSLILAPTGAGKTTAAIDWMQSKVESGGLVVYAAATIALVNQMAQDLQGRGVSFQHYRERSRSEFRKTGVIVTTNKSLLKIHIYARDAMVPYHLILDEIHTGLDEFMTSNRWNELMEQAILRSRQTLLLTGTLTDLQRVKLADVVGHALGSFTEADYCCYQFAPVKRNPLVVVPTKEFDPELVGMLQHMKDLKDKNKVLPRFVLIIATSRMEQYRELLSRFDLLDLAHVVSRDENTQEEVEEARTSTKPILISSPLFALGLNFEAEPDHLWCRFDHISADTNQIQQTVNRANRGGKVCKVRIYGAVAPDTTFRIPGASEVSPEIREMLKRESSLPGLLEEHFQISRTTYNALRDFEKNSTISLSILVRENQIQNFNVIQPETAPEIPKGHKEIAVGCRKSARFFYINQIEANVARVANSDVQECLWHLERLWEENRWAGSEGHKTGRELEAATLATLISLCRFTRTETTEPTYLAKKVSVVKLKRLWGAVRPWISEQFEPEKFREWAKVEAEKTAKIAFVVEKLLALQRGEISGHQLATALTQNARFREGLLALSNNEYEFIKLSKLFDELLAKRSELNKSGSQKQKEEFQARLLSALMELLEPLGVWYDRERDGNSSVAKIDQPHVPEHWDLSALHVNLTIHAKRLLALPLDQKVPFVDSPEVPGQLFVPRNWCERCLYFANNACALGKSVDWQDIYSCVHLATNCTEFKKLPAITKI